jgi:DNA-binding MarR family transcriptional regulator
VTELIDRLVAKGYIQCDRDADDRYTDDDLELIAGFSGRNAQRPRDETAKVDRLDEMNTPDMSSV